MRKYLEIGGVVATVVLIVFGVVAIALGVNGRNTVRDSLKAEQIVGTPDMTKAGIAAEAKSAGLPAVDQAADREHRRQGDRHRSPRT